MLQWIMFSSLRDFLLSYYTSSSARHKSFWCKCETPELSQSALQLICHPHQQQQHVIKTVPGTPVLVCLSHPSTNTVLQRKLDVLRKVMVVPHGLIVVKLRRESFIESEYERHGEEEQDVEDDFV